MSKATSLALGGLSVLPLLGFAAFVLLGNRLLTALGSDLAKIGVAYVVFSWVIVIAAIVFALTSRHISPSRKGVWTLLLFFLNMFALPVFWYKCIWSQPPPPAT